MSRDEHQITGNYLEDEQYRREIAGIYAGFTSDVKTKRSEGRYASRAIANSAQLAQNPVGVIDRHLRDAAAAEISAEQLEKLGLAIARRARALAARRGQMSRTA